MGKPLKSSDPGLPAFLSNLGFLTATFKSSDPGLPAFFSNLGFLTATFKSPDPGLYEFFQGCTQIQRSENQASSACRGPKTRFTKIKRFEKFAYNVGGFFKKAILLRSKIKNNKAPYSWLKQFFSEKILDFRILKRCKRTEGTQTWNTHPNLQGFFVHFFFLMYGNSNKYKSEFCSNQRTFKIQCSDRA